MRNEPRRSGFTKMEFLVIIFINVILIALLYPAIKPPNPDGPVGKMIPVTTPDEKNRVAHASGISFIPPPNWEQIRDLGPEKHWLRIAPRGSSKRRDLAVLIIGKVGAYNHEDRLPDRNDLEQFKCVKFQGFPAYERMVVVRKDSFDDPARSDYELYINRHGEWWNVHFLISEEMTELPAMMRKYINMIRFPPKAVEEAEQSMKLEQ